jgi:hypothetical protein
MFASISRFYPFLNRQQNHDTSRRCGFRDPGSELFGGVMAPGLLAGGACPMWPIAPAGLTLRLFRSRLVSSNLSVKTQLS